MGTPARILAPASVRRLKACATNRRYKCRNRTIVLLSFKAGLRACEIAGLDWTMLLRPDGKIDQSILISDSIAKNGRGRRIPVHLELRRELMLLHTGAGRPEQGPVIVSQKGGHMTSRGVVNWFRLRYGELGLSGCSSHSGRRTFITRAAKLIAKVGGSLRDVQELAGHRALTTTERYIEGDRDAQRKLVRML